MKIKGLENTFSARGLKDYLFIIIAMLFYCIGQTVFSLSNSITTGGAPGISSALYWGLGIPAQCFCFSINAVLIAFASRLSGFHFCIKTILGIIILTTLTLLAQIYMLDVRPSNDQPFTASVIGVAFCGTGVGLGLSADGGTGGTDIVAAIVNKYRDTSLERVILTCDLVITSSSYLASCDWEKVICGYVVLPTTSPCADQMVSSMHRSVQFFIISDQYEEIGHQISENLHRGCMVINASGFYSSREMKMLLVLAKKSESGKTFNSINNIDPAVFVFQGAVIGVYGGDLDRFKIR